LATKRFGWCKRLCLTILRSAAVAVALPALQGRAGGWVRLAPTGGAQPQGWSQHGAAKALRPPRSVVAKTAVAQSPQDRNIPWFPTHRGPNGTSRPPSVCTWRGLLPARPLSAAVPASDAICNTAWTYSSSSVPSSMFPAKPGSASQTLQTRPTSTTRPSKSSLVGVAWK
jgi:hypothetical protein